MHRQRSAKESMTLALFALILCFFVFSVYFCWTPDSLIPFVPDDVSFYSHLNLDKLHYSGRLARKWLSANNNITEDVFKYYSINPDIVDSLEEVALFALAESDLRFGKFGLIFKSKMSLEDLRSRLPSSYSVRQISNKIFIASSQIDLDESGDFISFSKRNRFRFINPFNKELPLVHGYVRSGSKFARFNVLYSFPQKDKLFFEIEDKNSFNYSLLGFERDNFFISENTFDFVFIFPRQESLDKLKNRIKTYLASRSPKKRKVVLPDNSFFVELVVDPQDFVFKKDGMIDYWRDSSGQSFEIAFSQNQWHTFISNNHILLKKIISIEREKGLISALYWEVDNSWLQRLVLQEKNQKIKGFLELK